jgi:MFS family permease
MWARERTLVGMSSTDAALAADRTAGPRELWRAVYLPTIVLAVAEGMLVPVLPLFVAQMGAGFALVGLALAAEAIGMLLGDLPAGSLLRRVDRKKAMLAGVAVVGASVALLPFAGGVVLVIGLRLLAGIGAALWSLSRHAYLTEATRAVGRGRALAAFGGATRVGHFVGPALGGVVAGVFGFAAAFWLYAAIAAAAFWLCARYLEARDPRDADPDHRLGHRAALAQVLRGQRRTLLVTGTGHVMAQMIRSGRRIVIPLYGAAVLGLDVQAVGWVLSAAALLDVTMFPLAGMLMDRLGRKWAIVPSFALQAVGVALVPMAGGFGGLLLVGCIIGVGNGIGSGTMMTLASDLARPGTIGEFLGVWRVIGDAGSMGGPVVVGAVADVVTLETAALVIAAVGMAAALVFAWGVPETLRRSATDAV